MFATSFDESDAVLGRPEGMSEKDCNPLSIARGVMEGGCPVVISCWKVTKEELEEINRTGRVWLVVAGATMPPVILSGEKAAVFGKQEESKDG